TAGGRPREPLILAVPTGPGVLTGTGQRPQAGRYRQDQRRWARGRGQQEKLSGARRGRGGRWRAERLPDDVESGAKASSKRARGSSTRWVRGPVRWRCGGGSAAPRVSAEGRRGTGVWRGWVRGRGR